MDEFDDAEINPDEAFDGDPDMIYEFLGEFMANGASEQIYRRHYCDIVANKVYNEFGVDGMCELLLSMDRRAEWISDIIIESSDLDDIAFKKFGTFDPDIAVKARSTNALKEMNEKLWRLRKKYAKLIVEEIIQGTSNDPV